jgi:FkbM family methyltransferase
MGLKDKLLPVISKMHRQASLCPWRSAFACLHPFNFKVRPPSMNISVVQADDSMLLLRFDGKHDFWFPENTPITPELWNEYLVVFWTHYANFHSYLKGSIKFERDDIVYDCGACEGFFTRLALQAGAQKVYCFEPSAIMCECLRRTFAKEISQALVVVEQKALFSVVGSAAFSQPEGDVFGGQLVQDGGFTVDLVTLDFFALTSQLPDFIKMDLEGAEYEALRGGSTLLKKHKPKLAVTTYHNEADYAAIAAFLQGCGYPRLKPSGATMLRTSVPRPMMIYAGSG